MVIVTTPTLPLESDNVPVALVPSEGLAILSVGAIVYPEPTLVTLIETVPSPETIAVADAETELSWDKILIFFWKSLLLDSLWVSKRGLTLST